MIVSQILLDTFDLIFDGLKSKHLLQKQIQYLNIRETRYTGVGLFVNFIHDEEIFVYKSEFENFSNIHANGDVWERIDGLEFKNEALDILADISVHLKNGIINYWEIFVKNGNDYPETGLEHYEMYQSWVDESKRRTIKR